VVPYSARPNAVHEGEDITMKRETTKSVAFIAVVGAVALGAGNSSWAAPVLSGTLAVKAAAMPPGDGAEKVRTTPTNGTP
jgi:hypothetical protein